ncbi:MAG: protein kinase [Planctomycetaceae bacterium]
MVEPKPNLDSLFISALEIESATERAAFLDQACAGDVALRAEVDRLLASNNQAGSFLAKPAPELGATLLVSGPGEDRSVAMEAGFAAAFEEEQAVVISTAGLSVLKSLGFSGEVPRVALRDDGDDPIVKPKSAEMPDKSDSKYQLQGEIARGGMGAILKGRDTDLGRDLAIKVLLDAHKDKPDVVQRFIEEAQIGGQLQHPGIAPVYELGQFADRRPFFSMKLVKGETFSKLLEARKDSSEDRGRFLGIFEQICQTMAYAHSRGVIHRDLKPANIMVGAFGEVQVMDWGLAKVLQTGGVADEKKAHVHQSGLSVIKTLRSGGGAGSDVPVVGSLGSQTMMGSVMGTPAYMPPEQALGEIDNLDERADVFGLGAILCEVLTGKPPYIGTDGNQVYRMASRGKLGDCFARLDACGAEAELIEIAKQSLAVDPHDRPRNAGVLAERITSYLTSVESRLHAAEVNRAAEAARAEEALQTAKEHELAASAERRARKLQMGLAAVFVVVLAVGGIAAAWTAAVQSQLKNDALLAEGQAIKARQKESQQRQRAEREEMHAQEARQQAEAEALRSLNMLADMQTERGLQASRDGQGALAALWFANAAGLTPHDRDRQSANLRRATTWSQQAMIPVALLKLSDKDAQRLEFQSNGSLFLTISSGVLRVWDWRNEVAMPWSEQFPAVTNAAMSPDGKVIAALLGGGDVWLVDVISGNMLRSFKSLVGMTSIEWSPDSARVAIAGTRLQVWNVGNDPVLESDWPQPANIQGVRFSRSGQRIVSCNADARARVYAINEPNLPAPLYPAIEHRSGIERRESVPVFCDNDRRLVTLNPHTRCPVLRDAETGALLPVVWKLTSDLDGRSMSVPTGAGSPWRAEETARY